MKQIEDVKVGELVVAQMFSEYGSHWVVRGSRGYTSDPEYYRVTGNRKIYEYWVFKVCEISKKYRLVKLEVPRIKWKRMPILHWNQIVWVPMQNLEIFNDVLCLDCNFSCAQKCKKALKKIND